MNATSDSASLVILSSVATPVSELSVKLGADVPIVSILKVVGSLFPYSVSPIFKAAEREYSPS